MNLIKELIKEAGPKKAWTIEDIFKKLSQVINADDSDDNQYFPEIRPKSVKLVGDTIKLDVEGIDNDRDYSIDIKFVDQWIRATGIRNGFNLDCNGAAKSVSLKKVAIIILNEISDRVRFDIDGKPLPSK